MLKFDRTFAAVDVISQSSIVGRLVEGKAGYFLPKHIEIVSYDPIELFICPVLSGAGHS